MPLGPQIESQKSQLMFSKGASSCSEPALRPSPSDANEARGDGLESGPNAHSPGQLDDVIWRNASPIMACKSKCTCSQEYWALALQDPCRHYAIIASMCHYCARHVEVQDCLGHCGRCFCLPIPEWADPRHLERCHWDYSTPERICGHCWVTEPGQAMTREHEDMLREEEEWWQDNGRWASAERGSSPPDLNPPRPLSQRVWRRLP